MAFLPQLQALLGDNLKVYVQDEGQDIDLPGLFADLPGDCEVYMCGPLGMLNAARQIWQQKGRAMSRLRFEVFGDSGAFSEQSFTVEVPALNRAVQVRADQTMLEALEEAGIDMIYDCRRGECGLCQVTIVDHDQPLDHRDVFFSSHERQEGTKICACVSRSCGGNLVIDTGYRREQAA